MYRFLCFNFVCLVTVFFNSEINGQNTYLFTVVDSITRYVANNDFGNESATDFEKLDLIYSFAVKVTNNNKSDALLALSMALVPYRNVPLRFSVLNFSIGIPLIASETNIFEKKNMNLPSKIYLDRPNGQSGDKDKIAHFFGAAFLAYSLNSFEITDFIGYFVEVFEESFGISKIDKRDLRTNRLGAEFGKILRKQNVKPSQIIMFFNLKNILLLL